MAKTLADIADLVWSYPVVGLCLLSAIFFTLRLGFVQFRVFPHALALLTGRYDDPEETGAISHLQALSAALSGTIGIGNIAGVAIAISVGGPGAVLWMWVAGLFGMATKFVECTLGTAYRQVDPHTGEVRGGPMYYIVEGLGPKWKPVAAFYAVTIAFAGFGFSCMFQSNQAASALELNLGVPTWISGLLLALLTGAVILGGIVSIGKWAARLVPMTCLVYVGGAFTICLMHADQLPAVLALIFREGTNGQAVLGGGIGGVIALGVRRAVFSNEAGLGSAAIAHAAVKTDEPVREGVVASLGPFIDTIIVSGATAFVIILAGNFGHLRMQTVAPALAQAAEIMSVAPVQPSACAQDDLQCYEPDGSFHKAQGPAAPLAFAVRELPATTEGLQFSYRGEVSGSVVEVRAASAVDEVLIELEMGGKECPNLAKDTASNANPWQTCLLKLDAEKTKALGNDGYLVIGRGAGASVITAPVPVRLLSGIALSSVSFDGFISGFGTVFITFAGFFFALSTMITWSYYGETASTWLFGEGSVLPYRLVFIVAGFVGAVYKLSIVISISDILVGLLVVPNVLAITVLSPRVAAWSRDYFARLKAGEFDPGSKRPPKG